MIILRFREFLRLGLQISHMDSLSIETRLVRIVPRIAGSASPGVEWPMLCDDTQDGPLQPKDAASRPPESSRTLTNVKDRLEVGRRARDHPQDLAGRGLLLERLFRLVEQPHVLDRDHRLVGEGLEKRDLLVGEGPASSRLTVITPMTMALEALGPPGSLLVPFAWYLDGSNVRTFSTSGM